ncbi:MAG: trehalose/maltose transport system substrate-binding protein [Solirubrobacteraceae bacterium]|nr:trehalose/maltose transport system substrate-binding protein [Solirubrobacteraceae bacterium]
MKRLVLMLCAILALSAFVAACGSSSNSGSSGGSGSSASSGKGSTSGAKVIDPKLEASAKGTVTYCQGKDTSGNAHFMIDAFNKKYASQGLKAKLTEFPASADEQRNQFIQRQQAKSGDCDVFSSDVIWTAEFASQKWLYDLTPYMQQKKAEYIQAPIETATYDGKIWGSPESSDAGFLYYRTDKVPTVPATWQDVYTQAAKSGGIVYQGAPYEGLTCDFLELVYAAGGSVLSADGTKSTFNSPQNVKALQFMVDGIKNGAAPKAVTTYMEPESLTAFQTGKPAFMRNWPYAYALNEKSAKVKGKFKVAPEPTFQGGGKGGILGGHNSVISAYSKNPGAALKLIDFIGSPEIQKAYAVQFSLSPVKTAVYDDAGVQKAMPFSAELKQAISQAHARPVSPVYPQISQAIYKNVNNALSGQTDPAAAIKAADAAITKALSTF